jgi:hypothetical protein
MAQRCNPPLQVETGNDLLCLMARLEIMHQDCPRNVLGRGIAGDQYAILSLSHDCSFIQARSLVETRIKAEHAHVSCQPLQAGTGDESRAPQRLIPHFADPAQIECFEDRENADPIPITKPMHNDYGGVIAQDEINLGYRNAHGLQQLRGCHLAFEADCEALPPLICRQIVVQLFIQPQMYLFH